MRNAALCGLILSVLVACKNEVAKNTAVENKDILIQNMDSTIRPGEDIFDFINGAWIKKNPIPSEESRWGIANLIVEENYLKLKKICEESEHAKGANGSSTQKIGDYWKMAMDSTLCDQNGTKPLDSLLSKINAINNFNSLLKSISELSEIGACSLINIYVTQDDKNSERMALYFYQGGLGLPNRDYYFNSDQRTKKIREAYPMHIAKMLGFLKYDTTEAKKLSEQILNLETKLASNSRKLEDLRDPYKNYNSVATKNLNKFGKNIDWNFYLASSNLKTDTCIIGQPEYYSNLDKLIKGESINTWKAYLKWNLISSYANTLSKEIVVENFNFYNKLIQGAEAQKPRWKKSLDATDNALGELLGQEFVKNYFDDKAKKRYNDLVEAIRESFKSHITSLDWMSEETKQKALVKLASMSKKVGYPDKWKDLSSLNIATNSYCENEMNTNKFWIQYNRNKLGKPVDRSLWDMTPQTYNAYYNPSNNEIVLPAAAFSVPGMRDEELDDALVYGYAAASTIGHEITHGFDDQGRQYDEKGNLKNWWTKSDEEKFNLRAKGLIDQFNSYILLDSMHINGSATLGENIADLGGIVLGLDAFKKTKQYQEGKLINGLNPLQRYFMGYGLGWLGHIRDQSLASRLLTDVHSPGKYRVLGPFVNVPEFYEAFNIQVGEKMYKADSARVKIW
ncbi:MAG: M13 family metallopeptidase [Saprospiraceae bacterium]